MNPVILQISPESVADLVDLEQELTSLQRGISQMERITPNEPTSMASSGGGGSGGAGHPSLAKSASEDDPFGDSFIYVPSYSILPPPPDSGRNRHKPLPNKTPETVASLDAMLSPPPGASSSQSPATAGFQAADNDDDNWLQELDQQNDVFDTTKVVTSSGLGSVLAMAPLASSESTATPTQQLTEVATGSGPLADLDIGLGSTSGNEDLASAILSLGELKAAWLLRLLLIIEVVTSCVEFCRFVISIKAMKELSVIVWGVVSGQGNEMCPPAKGTPIGRVLGSN